MQTASAAVLLAEKPGTPGDLRAAAWTQYGNALRFSGKFREAEAALEKAFRLLTPESDLKTRTNLLEITASLHRECGRLAEAEKCLAEAIEIQQRLGIREEEACDLVLCGICCKDAKHFARALSCHERALQLLDEDSNPILYVSACHGLIDTLTAAGRAEAAAKAFALVQPIYRSVSDVQLVGRIAWQRGRICLALGDKAEAVKAYSEAKSLLTELSEEEREEFEGEMAAAQA